MNPIVNRLLNDSDNRFIIIKNQIYLDLELC